MSSVLFALASLVSLITAWIFWGPFYGAVCIGLGFILGLVAYRQRCAEKECHPAIGKAVFITGCDTGFGHAIAKHLDTLGFEVFAGCLFPDGEGASSLSAACSNKLRVIPLDVTKQDDVDAAVVTIEQSTGGRGLWGVVNNAGVCFLSDLEVTPMETIQMHLDVNLLGQIRVVKGALPLLRKARGRIVNITSTNCYFYMPLMGAYGISKAAAEMFSHVLRLEMRKWGIKVATIHPGGFKTGLMSNRDSSRRYHQKCYEQLAAKLKQYYTPEYFEKSVHNMASLPSDLSPVYSAVTKALLERAPDTCYRSDMMATTMIRAVQCLPTPVFDYLVYNSKTFNRTLGLMPEVGEQD